MSGADVRETGGLREDFARRLVRQDLALDALERVVDRLAVAAQLLRHLLVREALEVAAEGVGLELREPGTEAEDEALQLLGRDDADRRIVRERPRKRVPQRAVAVGLLPRRRVAEGDVLV